MAKTKQKGNSIHEKRLKTTSTALQLQTNYFFTLPLELRFAIYELVLLHKTDSKKYEDRIDIASEEGHPALLTTCHAMRRESLPIFCKNRFRAEVYAYDFAPADHWFSSIPDMDIEEIDIMINCAAGYKRHEDVLTLLRSIFEKKTGVYSPTALRRWVFFDDFDGEDHIPDDLDNNFGEKASWNEVCTGDIGYSYLQHKKIVRLAEMSAHLSSNVGKFEDVKECIQMAIDMAGLVHKVIAR